MRKLLLSLCALLLLAGGAMAAKRPNFVFLVSEDNSIHYLKLYGYGASYAEYRGLGQGWLNLQSRLFQ